MTVYRYCGRDFHESELALLNRLISDNPNRCRAELSRLICEALHGYKVESHVLARRHGSPERSRRAQDARRRPAYLAARPDPSVRLSERSVPGSPILQPAGALAPLTLVRVEHKADSSLWNEFIQRYHYPGHKPLPGAHLRYLIYSAQRPVAALGFGAAAWQCAPRDRFIGWDHQQRQRNLHRVINNARFLILPWVQSRNLASMILSQASKILPGQWQTVYGYRPVLLETVVEKDRFQGTCYQADNWLYLGQTQGRG